MHHSWPGAHITSLPPAFSPAGEVPTRLLSLGRAPTAVALAKGGIREGDEVNGQVAIAGATPSWIRGWEWGVAGERGSYW